MARSSDRQSSIASPYWRVVEDCLVELYGMSRPEARSDVAELKARLKALPSGIDQ